MDTDEEKSSLNAFSGVSEADPADIVNEEALSEPKSVEDYHESLDRAGAMPETVQADLDRDEPRNFNENEPTNQKGTFWTNELKAKDDEEYAAEVAPSPANIGNTRTGQGQPTRTFGWISLAIAVASLFFWPAILGPAAAVLGFVAYVRGNRALGVWSIALGLISFITYVAIVPYYS